MSTSTAAQIARRDRVTREDLLMFVNACFSCTGQREFYSDGHGQSVSIEFLHRYVMGNYRALYARVLACGVNHFNQALIIANLLATGRDVPPSDRAEESALITRALALLPPHRAMHLLERIAERKVNNRRTRALVRRFLSQPESREFRAVKYRRCFRRAALHVHMPLAGELATFFLRGWRDRKFTVPLFETFRQAHYAEKAIYDLPLSIAEGLAEKHGVARATFLRRIEPRLTVHERMRLQDASAAALGSSYEVDWTKLPLTKLASYVLSRRDRASRAGALHDALESAAKRSVRRTAGLSLGKVACVLDRSFSSSGSSEKRRRPLAVALAVSYWLRAAAADYRAFWTLAVDPGPDGRGDVLVDARGSTDLATPILDALETKPDLLVIVSDGFDNDPPGIAGKVLAIARAKLDAPPIVHLNPVFDSESYAPKTLSPTVPTMGIREADDIPTLLLFARFAMADAPLDELLTHVRKRAADFLNVPLARGLS